MGLGHGCGSCEDDTRTEPTPRILPKLDGQEKVLATVEEVPLTAYDVAQFLNVRELKSVGDDEIRSTLEMLVQQEALAHVMFSSMSQEERNRFEHEMALHRDRLLMRAMIRPRPVPQTRVREYYEAHPVEFGARAVVRCDILSTDRPLTEGEFASFQRAAGDGTDLDWQHLSARLVQEGFPATYRTDLSDHALHPAIRKRLLELEDGDVTGPFAIQGTPVLLRRTSSHQLPPRPLSEVERQIRRMLAPAEISDAIRDAQDAAAKKARIEYIDRAGDGSS